MANIAGLAAQDPNFIKETTSFQYPENIGLNQTQARSWFLMKLIDLTIEDFRNSKTKISKNTVQNLRNLKKCQDYFFHLYSSPQFATVAIRT